MLDFWVTEAVFTLLFLCVAIAAVSMAAGKWNPSKAVARKFGVVVIFTFDVAVYYWIWRLLRG